MSLADPKFSLAEQTELFKINYYKKSENMYNSDNVLDASIKKRYDFTGKQRFVATPLSFSGGVGAGTLPKANSANYEGAIITSNRVYATATIEREAIKASSNDAGAFVQATAETVKKAVESYMRFCSAITFGDGTGILAKGGDGVTNITKVGSVYTIVFGAAGWKEANLEERDYLNLVTGLAADNTGGSADSVLLEVIEVIPASRTVKLEEGSLSAALNGLVGAPLPANAGFAMQNSYLKVPYGLKKVAALSEAGSGSIHGINVQRRWSMEVDDAGGAGVTVDRMLKLVMGVEKKMGKQPNLIVTGFQQFQNILSLLEDHKRYQVPMRNMKGKLSFDAVEFMGTKGVIPLVYDRFCEDDRIYFLNTNFIERHHRPDFGWFDDDGTVFLRDKDEDNYSARYGGYWENFITPTAHGVLKGLAL